MNNRQKRRLSWYELLFWIPIGFALWSFQNWPIFSDVQRMTKVQSRRLMVRVVTVIAPLVTVAAILMLWAGHHQKLFMFAVIGVFSVWLATLLITRYGIRLEIETGTPNSYVDRVSWREMLMSLVILGTAGYAVIIFVAEPMGSWMVWLPSGMVAGSFPTFVMWYFLPLVHPRAR